jgi:hypothetical protein
MGARQKVQASLHAGAGFRTFGKIQRRRGVRANRLDAPGAFLTKAAARAAASDRGTRESRCGTANRGRR